MNLAGNIICKRFLNPISPAPFLFLLRKGGGPKMVVPPWIQSGGLPHHNATSIHGTPLGCHCPGGGSDFVPI